MDKSAREGNYSERRKIVSIERGNKDVSSKSIIAYASASSDVSVPMDKRCFLVG